MNLENIDRLFRENLEGYTLPPSADSFQRLEKKLNRKPKVIYYWIAASLALFIVAIPIFFDFRSDFSAAHASVALKIDHPPYVETNFSLPLSSAPASTFSSASLLESKAQNTPSEKSEETQAPIPRRVERFPNPKRIAFATLAITHPEFLEKKIYFLEDQKKSTDFLRIKYIASSRKKKQTRGSHPRDRTNLISKVLEFGEKMEPGSVIASIKTAKYALLNRGL